MRYESQAFGWWFHDVVVHPISGTIGLLGNLTRSFRLMALAHHLHNGSAPSNDAITDYIEAASRACHNETADNPTGTRTPDELSWIRKQAQIATGRTEYIPDAEAESILKRHGVDIWDTQACGGSEPPLLTKTQIDEGRDERRLERALADAEQQLSAFLNRRFNRYEIRDLGLEGKEALRAKANELQAAVDRARRALARERAGVSVREILDRKPVGGTP